MIGLLAISTMPQAGCTQLSQYDITINDRSVYEPTPPLRVQGIEDPALEDCLQQTITDTRTTEPSALVKLNCSDAGIVSLSGLEQFHGLRSLKLSGNTIRNLLALERLTELQQLWLNSNNIVDPIPVLRMPSLRQLDLTDNPRLQCPVSDKIPSSLQLTLPDHCNTT